MCGLAQTFRSLQSYTLNISPIKIREGGLGDVMDNSGDIACALVTRIPDSRGWWDDTYPARYSGDSSDH